MIFFLKLILKMFKTDPFDVADIPEMTRFCTIIINQSELLSSYVEDLLDFRKLKDGIFSLSPAPF